MLQELLCECQRARNWQKQERRTSLFFFVFPCDASAATPLRRGTSEGEGERLTGGEKQAGAWTGWSKRRGNNHVGGGASAKTPMEGEERSVL